MLKILYQNTEDETSPLTVGPDSNVAVNTTKNMLAVHRLEGRDAATNKSGMTRVIFIELHEHVAPIEVLEPLHEHGRIDLRPYQRED